MRVVVTGASGFIGWHLVDAMMRRGDIVQAWMLRVSAAVWEIPVESVFVDITDPTAISSQLMSFVPDLIVHLAAQSYPARSWEQPASTYQVNVIGAIHLLEAVRFLPSPPRVLMTGSSAEYAEPATGNPISESAETEPNSPYGTSKLAVDHLVKLYVRRYNLDLIRVRPFYFVGPRKTGDVCSDFAKQIVAIERGEKNTLRVGALEVVRDIIDGRDGANGFLYIAGAGKRGELYNICGGGGVSIGEVLETYRRLAIKPIAIAHDPALVRPLEQKVKIGNSDKLRALGWKPEHDLADTLGSILEYWRANQI